MKLAFCLFKYFPFGGLQRDFLRIAKECMRRGHQVEVFTMHWEGEQEPGLTVHIVPVKARQNHSRNHEFWTQIQAKLPQYDRVVGFNKMPGLDIYYAADSCYQAKARLQRGAWYRWSLRYRHFIAAEKAVFANTVNTEILLLSKPQKEEFMRFYNTPSGRFHLLPPGITQDHIAPLDALARRQRIRHDWGIGETEFLLLLIGSGFKTKGLDRILFATASLPEEVKTRVHVYVIGKDKSYPFERLSKKLNIVQQVRFLGGRTDVPSFLWAADLLLHPAYNENTGSVLLEAIVAGLPVLTTDVCGYAEYVEQAKAGIVLPSPFTQSHMNQTLLDMLLSKQRALWQQNARKFAETADIYSLPERAVDLIEKLSLKIR